MDNLRLGGPLGGSVEHLEGKDEESVVGILRFLCGCPCLCWLRTEGLVSVSKYWTYLSHVGVYGPSKPSSQLSTEGWLSPLFHWLLLERSWVWTHESVSRHIVDCVRSPPSWGSGSIQICWQLYEKLLYVDHVRYVWSRAIRRPSVESVWRVGRIFPCRVYIDSNRRDSQLWVIACLWLPSSSNFLD
jgi:hypothetical protein